jgi:orotate phosphoribosyltransferase
VTDQVARNARELLLELLRTRAVLHGDFVLSSGQHSSVYLDARVVTLSAAGSGLVGRVMLDALRDLHPDAVAGLAIGADPLVASVAAISGLEGGDVDALIVRKEAKAHGAGRRIEGPWRAGMRIAILEDTMTTGASSLQAAQAVAEAGGTVVCVLGLIDREQGAREAVEAAGYEFRTVFTAAEVLGTPA